MKKILVLLLLLTATISFSQETTEKPPKEYFRLYYSIPGAIGNNVMAKANKGKLGLGLAVTFTTIDRFHILGGYEINQYDVTDKSLAGNIEETNVSQFYVGGIYKIPITRTIEINPQLNIGYITFTQMSDGENYGHQSGPAFTPGFTFDYKPTGNLRLFVGLNYCLAFPETHTNGEYKSFFGTIQMLNIVTGIKL